MKLLGDKSQVGQDNPEQPKQLKDNHVPFPESLFTKPKPIPEKRVIYLDGRIYMTTVNEPNILNNSKYTVISFLPLVLYHQFRYFFNMFFLIIALSQFVDMLKVGFMFTYVAPLILVLGFTLAK